MLKITVRRSWIVLSTLLFPLLVWADPRPEGSVPDDHGVQVQRMHLLSGDEADVYVPRMTFEPNARSTDTLPLVAFLQGALVDKSNYTKFGRRLAEHGFVVVIPNHSRTVKTPQRTITGFLPEVNQVTDVLDSLVRAAEDPDSILYHHVDTTRLAVVGHSLGGGVGLYAAANFCEPQSCSTETFERPSALKAVVGYGVNSASWSGEIVDYDTNGVAVALIQGTLDGRAHPDKADATVPTLEPPHALVQIAGANHFSLCDVNAPAGAIPDPNAATLDQDRAIELIARWTSLWLKMHLGSPGTQ